MKILRMFLVWPLIFTMTWYFFSFQTGVIVSLAYLHIVIVLLFQATEKQKETIAEIADYIKNKDNLIDARSILDSPDIDTSEGLVKALLSIGKQSAK